MVVILPLLIQIPAFQKDLHSVQNPYGDGDAIEKIMSILSNKPIPEDMKKDFYDL